ncbi:B12-binding domain-containing radical SAM protein [Budviciaceae bacterium BWR-B9]|uniref:B12-binding domain-containing radical SAM protein n=1 Tax=Limnobaculum allomyrinae TaxID=2791986 RepID=A0ABS1IMI4_9GAMM|nr:radical SAM protein [Limnobaculum allomyrinae]MBK5142955.1 B12-binding domain-containing radical SAM protein [Limnobaculum allomyrinae]
MRIILLRPNMGDYRTTDAMPPLAIGILAARSIGHEVIFYDDRVEEIPETLQADLIAISVETFTALRSYQLANRYRAQGNTVVMGGYHPTFLPDEVLEHADSVIIGDAEGAWEQLLQDKLQGTLQRYYYGDHSLPLNDYLLDRTVFSGKKYAPLELIQYTRGCRFACDFCSIHGFYHSTVRARPVEQLREELLALDSNRFIAFVDDNLFANRTLLEALLTMLKPLKRRWGCQISIDVARNTQLLDQLAEAGCRFALIGFESLNAQNLKQMGKAWNRAAGDYDEVVKALHDRGINIYGTFVFGYDEDDEQTIQQSIDFALRNKLEIANFNLLIPTPGSKLYQRLAQEGRLISPQWWKDPDYRYGDPIFQPEKITAERLTALCFSAKKQFYSYPSIANRLLNLKKRTYWKDRVIALLANIISHREIIRKQGKRLGEKG